MNGTITSARSAGYAPARLAVAVPQLRNRTTRATRETYTDPVRREKRSMRPVAAIGVASMIITGSLYAGAELVLELLDRPALLAAPSDAVRYVSRVNEIAPPALLALGVIVAVTGIALIIAVSGPPGRLARHLASSGPAVASNQSSDDAPAEPGSVQNDGVQHDGVQHDGVQDGPRSTPDRFTPDRFTPDRFTAKKAIAEAMAYDALRPALPPTVRLDARSPEAAPASSTTP